MGAQPLEPCTINIGGLDALPVTITFVFPKEVVISLEL